MNTQTGEHLTTSRISRLLRPLRVRCQKLASYSPEAASQRSRGSVVVTYGSSSRHSGADAGERRNEPPLAVIPPPEKLSVLSKLDRSSREKLELSRRIYDVRDAFRNILQATLTSGTGSRRSTPQPSGEKHARSLAAMCASIVGSNLEDQIRMSAEEREGEEANDEEDQDILDSLYDAVYPQYRKHTVISHALSFILTLCSSYHTLLAILLELTISYNLTPESRMILHHLLARSLQLSTLTSTSDTLILEIVHPVHSRYLVHLLDACSPPAGRVITAETFVQTLSEVICGFSADHGAQAWTCKATIHLARSLRSKNYSAFLSMCSSAGHFLALHAESSKNGGAIPASLVSLASRLGKWLSHACQRLHDISTPPLDAKAIEEISIISDIIVCANASRLHHLSESQESRVFFDAIACLSAMSLAPPIAGLLPKAVSTSLHSILGAAPAKSETLGILIDVTMSQVSKPSEDGVFNAATLVRPTIAALERWASTLRAHAYHLLETSLWSSALVHVEHLTPETGSHYDPASHHSAFLAALERLRHEIVRRVDAAERRCFAHSGDGVRPSSGGQTPRKGTVPAGSQWRWEDMLGCWVQKTPAPAAGSKRRRSAAGPAQIPAKHMRRTDRICPVQTAPRAAGPDRHRPTARTPSDTSSTSTATAGRQGPSHTSRPRYPDTATSASTSTVSSRLSTPQDEEENVFLARASDEKSLPARRLSNFMSILRDAQMNRVVLHADSSDDEGAWLHSVHGPKTRHLPAIRPEGDDEDDEDDTDIRDARGAQDQLSSDDVLNLFAYRSSE
ncbi:uncharacterized protein PHACADRAFT_196521 [Phanerochaete carnosa HHB-10118-sp]|uniref:Uncharacterized protein n=1 Tax=Phanerochaete carnosa (strain HHB-10118-sp) TaxID=650164 RepID=K5W566_PHACS|nr:uncharacterized protein PHACADRAFT_196521 [Phanerochaete carnosa HHB-10118-sp]EKM54089.1 hypothetical protein PHACADRAFT_196521 [Phanerochaete carnosa HHB-10118-sp]